MAVDVARHVRQRLPEFATVMARFPLAIVATVALAIYLLLDLHKGAEHVILRQTKIPGGLTAAFSWGIASALWSEAKSSRRAGLLVGLLGCAVIVALIAFTDVLEFNLALFIAALGIALSVAAFIRRGEHNGAYWLFNHTLWTGLGISIIALLLSAGGISAIIESLRYLFGLPLPYTLHEKVWVFTGFIVAPIYWMSLIPRDAETGVYEGPQAEFLSKSVAVLSRYILVPLLIVYGAILHAYAVKIAIESGLPKGRIGWMVLSFGTLVAFTALAVFPTRRASGALVRLFWTWWPWLLVVPLALLFIAIGQRIRQYGLTEPRYMVALAGVWLASLVATQGLGSWVRERDLRLVSGALAVLLLLASVGPWGMTGWSVRNQVREFSTRLAAAGLLKDGRVPPDARPSTTLLASDRQRLHAIIDYLNNKRRLGALRPLFEGQQQNPFDGFKTEQTGRYDQALANSIRDRLSIGRYAGPTQNRFVSYQSQGAGIVSAGQSARVIGPLTVNIAAGQTKAAQDIATPAGKVVLSLQATTLSVTDPGGSLAVFDLTRLLAADGPMTAASPQQRPPYEITASEGALRGKLLITNASGRIGDKGMVDLTYMAFWMVLEAAP